MDDLKFIPLKDNDFILIKEIYDYYILNSTSTFHIEPVSIIELKEYIFTNHSLYKSFLIYYKNEIAGYCYYTYYKKRQAYDRTSEVTLYLKPAYHHKGIGIAALRHMEDVADKSLIKNFIAIITETNYASVKLFEKAGYFRCAHFRQVGEKFGQILDVVAYQKTFQ
jgi:L-amino acid N-acyltransferase YncA